ESRYGSRVPFRNPLDDAASGERPPSSRILLHRINRGVVPKHLFREAIRRYPPPLEYRPVFRNGCAANIGASAC
ncbi:MAG: hypothetical protein AAFU79_12630, partial [Myxococcota bacterium]